MERKTIIVEKIDIIRNLYMSKTNNKKNGEFDSFEYYFNRELSLIEFQKRVLFEAENESNPLLERMKFTAILSSNLDEFFMIRVAGLKSQVAGDVIELSYDGMTPKSQLIEIRRQLLPIYKKQGEVFNNSIIPGLANLGIVFHKPENLDENDIEKLRSHFTNNILPLLTPLSLGPANPFPRLINRSLNIAFVLSDKKHGIHEKHIAFIQIPSALQRIIPLEWREGYHYVLIEDIINAYSNELFPGLEVELSSSFRVTRDADIEIAEDEADDLLEEIAEQIKERRWGRAAVRLEVGSNMPEFLANLLMNSLELEPNDVYVHNRPLNLGDFMDMLKLDIRSIKDIPFATRNLPQFTNDGSTVFDAIKNGDLLVHHPFDSFSTSTVNFINSAADDPDVLAIKVTLYRTGLNSDIVGGLKRAADNGKYVTAFVELKARFDEEKNIIWAKELEKSGAHVVYGVPGLKTHCKIAIVVRRESGKLKTYIHLSTGNYNQITARLYTDVGFFTANPEFAEDALYLFNYLTAYSYHTEWNAFSVGPINLREKIIELIDRETELHTPENPGLIIVKMNSLAHREVIPALYRASKKGVKIQLIIRGICCLKPNIPDVSENIEVRSIIGRFLEHSRIIYFKNGGKEEFYLSSADWMSRNLHKRVELMWPVNDKSLKKQLWEILAIYLKDNTKAWELHNDGSYQLISPKNDEKPISAQQYFLDKIKKKG